ncbi:uncharacterized protein LOC129592945 [Paramacrobiotus metropolitanus]|uniref:uncharacterized protein LOC129592945 n=1 Tax=Paramacrobiotus metropolitanus TaxID=2943436 RepID=UPI002446595C|nr:uncharacterized protein LOC129592945 [Paramacrobiotus metropolitanus]
MSTSISKLLPRCTFLLQYVTMLFERFGLASLRKPIAFNKPHATKGSCKPKCAKCRVNGAIRNEEEHAYKMEADLPYRIMCALCGIDIEWNEMQYHVRTVHKDATWNVCRCWAPLAGQYAPSTPHGVSCPLRTFPLMTGKRGERYRHKPFPPTIEKRPEPTFPDKKETVRVNLGLVVREGRAWWQLTWPL